MASRDNLGCYDPAFEHDACGVAFVADLQRPASHRGRRPRADGAREPRPPRRLRGRPGTGDGAGALIQIPDGLLS